MEERVVVVVVVVVEEEKKEEEKEEKNENIIEAFHVRIQDSKYKNKQKNALR